MQIPVLVTDLCSGTGPDDPALTVHGSFVTEAAARRVMLAVMAEKASGQLRLAPGTDVFTRPRTDLIERESFAAAIAEQYTIDYTRLAYQAPKNEEPAPEPTPASAVAADEREPTEGIGA